MRSLSLRWSIPLVVLAILAMAAAVLYESRTERSVADENFVEATTARDMAVDLSIGEAQIDAYLATGDRASLDAWVLRFAGRAPRERLRAAASARPGSS